VPPLLGVVGILAVGIAALFLLNPFAIETSEPPSKGKAIAQLPEPKETPPFKEPASQEPTPPSVEKKGPVETPKQTPVEKAKKQVVEKKGTNGPDKKTTVEEESPEIVQKKGPPEKIKKAALPPELQKKVDEAIGRGVAYLQSPQARAGSWCAKAHPVGYSSLVALTLLECGLPRDDRLIRDAADEIRSRVAAEERTYDLSLAVLFLDRLGEDGDSKLIRQLAMRLAAAQNASGGWGYPCPKQEENTLEQLYSFLREDQAYRLTKKEKGSAQAGKPPIVPDRFRRLGMFQVLEQGALGNAPGRFGDNSNTQFALLALWVARRHGAPLGRIFDLAERRFRSTQHLDGGWGYMGLIGVKSVLNATSSRSMTCVGLLGLAIGRGSEFEPLLLDKAGSGDAVKKLANQDAEIVRGLKRLGQVIGTPCGRTSGLPMENTYFLWSVQRVAVLYGLSTIGDKDWYRWGLEILLSNQQSDGRWSEMGNAQTDPSIDTCFALLFLNRIDLVPDLSRNLRLFVPIVDPDRKGGGK
jgi:hypothetical protein